MKKTISNSRDSIGRIESVTGVILAGGASRRMGRDKALLPFGNGRFIESIYWQMAALFPEVIIVCKSPGQYPFLPCWQVTDIVPGCGVLAGVQSGLIHAANPVSFVVACDMPFLNVDLIQHLCSRINSCDIVLPASESGDEPLHAVYRRTCLPAIEASLGRGERRIASFFPQVRLRKIPPGEIASIDPGFASFRNINTPEEYCSLRHVDTHHAAWRLRRRDPVVQRETKAGLPGGVSCSVPIAENDRAAAISFRERANYD